jgi:hypothetical protein
MFAAEGVKKRLLVGVRSEVFVVERRVERRVLEDLKVGQNMAGGAARDDWKPAKRQSLVYNGCSGRANATASELRGVTEGTKVGQLCNTI